MTTGKGHRTPSTIQGHEKERKEVERDLPRGKAKLKRAGKVAWNLRDKREGREEK